jgi:hypothetical protein
MTTDAPAVPHAAARMRRSFRGSLREFLHSSNYDVGRQLQAYAQTIVDNLEANIEANHSAEVVKPIRDQIAKAIEEFQNGDSNEIGFFLTVKALEYRVLAGLAYDMKQMAWFIEHDLRLTPATTEDINNLKKCFFDCADADKPDSKTLAKVTHAAISYWQRYAEMMLRAVQRERYIAAFLFASLAAYLLPLILQALKTLLRDLPDLYFSSWHWGELVSWIGAASTQSIIAFISLGCAGAVVSMSLAGRQINATRPFDDRYTFWSSVPRLLIGAIAGILVPSIASTISPLLNAKFTPTTDAMALLAFVAGFSDQIFFRKLVDATWRVSGLESTEKPS